MEAGDDNRGDTRSFVIGSAGGKPVTAAMVKTQSTPRSGGGTSNAGSDPSNPVVTVQTTPRVIGTRSYPVPTDFNGSDPGIHIGLYTRARWFVIFARDTAGFHGGYTTEGY